MSQLKRTALKRPIAPMSAKRKRDLAVYTRPRREFLGANPTCQWPAGCRRLATEIHHKRGRGKFYLDTTTFCGLCAEHHREAHAEPAEAKASGVSLTRLGIIER